MRWTHELETDAPGRPLHHGHAAGARAGSRGGERPRGHRQPSHRSPSHRRIGFGFRPQPLLLLLPFTDSHPSSMQIIQCNKIGLKRWLQLVGLGGNGGVRARARLGDSHGWMALHVFLALSLTHTGKASLVRQAHSNRARVGLCAHTGPTSYFEAL